jgi:ribulose-phosphate 3-epimerase
MMKEKSSQAEIQVDGGVNVDNVAEVVSAGADIVVMGSAFYNSDDYSRTVETIRERCCK